MRRWLTCFCSTASYRHYASSILSHSHTTISKIHEGKWPAQVLAGISSLQNQDLYVQPDQQGLLAAWDEVTEQSRSHYHTDLGLKLLVGLQLVQIQAVVWAEQINLFSHYSV